MDADLWHDEAPRPRMYALLEHGVAELVIDSRSARGVDLCGRGGARLANTRIAKLVGRAAMPQSLTAGARPVRVVERPCEFRERRAAARKMDAGAERALLGTAAHGLTGRCEPAPIRAGRYLRRCGLELRGHRRMDLGRARAPAL